MGIVIGVPPPQLTIESSPSPLDCSTPLAKIPTFTGIVRPGFAAKDAAVPTGSPQTADQTTPDTNVTFTSKLLAEWLPEASVAVQVTVVFPTGIEDPLAGRQATLGDASPASEAVGAV